MKHLQSELKSVMSIQTLNYQVAMQVAPDKSYYVVVNHLNVQSKSRTYEEARFDFDAALYLAEKQTYAHTGN